MSARGVWAVLASTAVVCAACGSASRSSTSQSSTSKLALSAYLVRGHEETGLPPTGRATDYLTATQWTSKRRPQRRRGGQAPGPGELPRGDERPDRLEQRSGRLLGDGVGSRPPRRRERRQRSYRNSPPRRRVRRASPSRAFGAEGWGQPDTDANILFTEGRCLMVLVGDELAAGSDNKPVVLAAVHAVWARTHDKPGACATLSPVTTPCATPGHQRRGRDGARAPATAASRSRRRRWLQCEDVLSSVARRTHSSKGRNRGRRYRDDTRAGGPPTVRASRLDGPQAH